MVGVIYYLYQPNKGESTTAKFKYNRLLKNKLKIIKKVLDFKLAFVYTLTLPLKWQYFFRLNLFFDN